MTKYEIKDLNECMDFSVQKILSFFILIILMMISVRYCDLHDYRAYFLTYTTDKKMKIEAGYMTLASVFYDCGLPFYIFYGFIVCIALFLIWYYVINNVENPIFIMLLFVLYPYINVLQQIRSFIGAAIIITGLRFLIDDKPKIALYILTILFAMQFHTTTFVYTLFILAVVLSYETIKKITFVLFVMALPLLFLIRIIAVTVFPYIPYFSMKYLKYLNTGNLLAKSTLFDWCVYFFVAIVIYCITDKYFYSLTKITQKYIKISYIVLCLTMLRGLGNNGYRVAMMMFPLLYVMLDKLLYEIDSISDDILYKKYSKHIIVCIMIFIPLLNVLLWWGPLNPRMFEIVKNEMWKVWDYYYLN